MADFGIGETLAATSAAEGGSKGAEGLGALGGAKGAETAAGAGAADALAPAAAAGAPLDLLAGGTAAGTAVPSAVGTIFPTAASGILDAGAIGGVGGDLLAGGLPGATGASAAGLGSLDSLAAGGSPNASLTAPATAAPAAPSAGAVAPPAGVSSPLGADPTAILGANAPSPLDTAAYPAGPIGAPGAAPAAAPTGTSGGFLNTLESSLSPSKLAAGIGDSVAKNPLGLALAAGGLGYNIMQGQKQSAAVNALNAEAQQQGATGAQLEGYLTSGTLPPGLQASVAEAVQNAKATAISNMASQGLSTDPTKNTALASELAAIDQQVPILTAQIGQQLLQSGEAASGLASNLYTSLANIDQTQTAQIGKSIAAMAAALSGKQQIPGTNISVSTG